MPPTVTYLSRLKILLQKGLLLPWHPFLLTLYANLFFLGRNISQVNLYVANRLIVIFMVSTLLLILFMRIFTSDFQKSGAIALLGLMFFFSYGHLRTYLNLHIPILAMNKFLLPPLIVLLAAGVIVVRKLSRTTILALTQYLTVVGMILLMFPVIFIFRYQSKVTEYQRSIFVETVGQAHLQDSPYDAFPDIYFIVLDGYGRADVLKTDFGLDNSGFLNDLQKRGFYTADCSVSNYSQTELSFASTLNMTYPENIITNLPAGDLSPLYFEPYIKHNQVRTFFESLGYKTVAFFTGYYWTHWDDATYFLGDPRFNLTESSVSPFEESFLKTTLFRLFSDTVTSLGNNPASQANANIALFTLDQLPTIAQVRGPKFVFAHIMLPHPPYVFDPNGKIRDLGIDNLSSSDPIRNELVRIGYHDQVLYVNNRILPVIDTILSRTNGNVIIVLEGDHGPPDAQEEQGHVKNLSAYYFPNRDYASLYPTISPVNIFRIVLTDYFGQSYPLLEDSSYFSATSAERTLKLIPNICSSK